MSQKIPVHTEVALKLNEATSDNAAVKSLVLDFLSTACPVFRNGPVEMTMCDQRNAKLLELVESIRICDLCQGQQVSFWQAEVEVLKHSRQFLLYEFIAYTGFHIFDNLQRQSTRERLLGRP